MSVLVNKDSKIIVQGFTGSEGTFHATQMIEYGSNVVGGVTPGKGGQVHLDRPVFNTVAEAVENAQANTTIIFVPPAFAADAIMEAADAGIKVIITITEGIPVADMVKASNYIAHKNCRLIGYGISTAIGIGGDPIIGTTTKDAVELFMNDPETEAIVMIGEIGGQLEVEAAKYVKETGNKKPVIGFIAGETAPAGRTMGHAGAIVGGSDDTAEAKKRIMSECGIHVVNSPAAIGKKVAEILN